MMTTISPIDNQICFQSKFTPYEQINQSINDMINVQRNWETTNLSYRINILNRFLKEISLRRDEICNRLVIEMGRPIKYVNGEVNGLLERANHMIEIATESLQDDVIDEYRKIQHKPLGLVMIIPAWNYPYLISINSLIPSLLAGNAVLFKGSSQTPSVGRIYQECLEVAGLHPNLFLNLYIDHQTTGKIVSDRRINYVSFTGSVRGGQIIANRANNYKLDTISDTPSLGFKPITLELGGKDPAYVREDADLKQTAIKIADGTFFNSGQCCCAIERVYVHRNVYDEFISLVKKEAEKIILGNPLDEDITMGPLAKLSQATYVKKLIQKAKSFGATQVLNQLYFKNSIANENYIPPQILVEVGHNMEIMNNETFGPVMPIMKVSDDKAAIDCINACNFGLTNSIWTQDIERGEELCDMIESGTCFINKCGYIDPMLPWSGVKDTGMGCSLSYLGYLSVTRPKSYYLNKNL